MDIGTMTDQSHEQKDPVYRDLIRRVEAMVLVTKASRALRFHDSYPVGHAERGMRLRDLGTENPDLAECVTITERVSGEPGAPGCIKIIEAWKPGSSLVRAE